jgi:hypothetical protein
MRALGGEMSNKKIVLSTGREIYAHCGIIGINDELEVYDGYDGTISEASLDAENLDINKSCDRDEFSHLERLELATMMIARWTKYRWETMRLSGLIEFRLKEKA